MYFHASQIEKIKALEPRISNHNIPLIYFSDKRENVLVYLRQYRTIGVCELRSKIFRQVVQKFCRLADASQGIFAQHDGNRFKQGVRFNLCGVALMNISTSMFIMITE